MNEGTINPLTAGDLEGAAYLCLEAAALTDRDQFPPGSGNRICSILHARKRRFQVAQKKMKSGIVSLLELGITHKDCKWAVDMSGRARDKEGWKAHFTAVKDVLEQSAKEVLAQT